jgi:hypothetical protein
LASVRDDINSAASRVDSSYVVMLRRCEAN